MSKLSLEEFNKESLIDNLLEKRIAELNIITGGNSACVMGCSGEPIGCSNYCVGPCPKGCLNYCMVAPTCANQ